MRTRSLANWLQLGLAGLALAATAWLLWPWQEGHSPATFFLPTATPTITRFTVQRLPSSTPFVPTATPLPVIYIVQPKDVLGIIAQQYGVTEQAIMEANGLKSDLIIDGQELVIPNPQRTPAVTPTTGTPLPTNTPTSAYHYIAPALLTPADGTSFQGRDARIVLTWASTAILQQGEWYEVRLWTASQGEAKATHYYTQALEWVVPSDAYPGNTDGTLYWTVAVVYRARQTSPLSPSASARHFSWK